MERLSGVETNEIPPVVGEDCACEIGRVRQNYRIGNADTRPRRLVGR